MRFIIKCLNWLNAKISGESGEGLQEKSRLENSVRNSFFGLILKIITLLGAFTTKTLIIYFWGIEYIGLDGLFSSVLQLLNMTELGFGSAIVYKLYEPIANGEVEKVCALLKLYCRIYKIIGTIIFGIGLCLLPFISLFISGDIPDGINIHILYMVYLLNTCIGYWLSAYKTALLDANQRNDLVSKVSCITSLTRYTIQFLAVLLTHDYYVFVIIIPLTTFMTNITNAILVKLYYPQYSIRNGAELQGSDKDEIKRKVGALLINKIGVTVINASDNLVISSFLGLTLLGIYDSYYYIFSTVYGFFSVFHIGITASVGNRIIKESRDDNYIFYKHVHFINSWAVGWASICLVCLFQPFMEIWIGAEKTLGTFFAILMGTYAYFWLIRFTTIIFKNAQGLWWEDRFRPALEGALNLVLNLIMVRFIGIYGITLSTIGAMLLISLPWETLVLFKNYFLKSPGEYILTLFKWMGVTVCVGFFTYLLCRIKFGSPIILLVYKVIVCLAVPNLLFIFICRNSDEFLYLKRLVTRVFKGL